MARAYSEDLRERVMHLTKKGESAKEISKILNIGLSTIYTWKKKYKKDGNLTPKKMWQNGYGHKVKDLEDFKKFSLKNQGLTCVQLAEKWGNISAKTIRKWLLRIGFTRKKRLMDTKNPKKKTVRYTWMP